MATSLAPREVCASAVKAADAANKTAIATESVTLRIDVSFYCRDVPLVCPKPVDLTRSAVLVHIDDCSVCGGAAFGADTDAAMSGQATHRIGARLSGVAEREKPRPW